jgi:hypothetical protein
MNDAKTPREKIAASLQLRGAADQYLKMDSWTPTAAALLMCGVHPPAGCTDVPDGGVGLDGVVFESGANDRFHHAIRILGAWQQAVVDGHVDALDHLPPYKYLIWCEAQIEEERLRVDRKWVDLLLDVAYGPSLQSSSIVSVDVAEHASRTEARVDAVLEKLAESMSESASNPRRTRATSLSAGGPEAIRTLAYLTTDELAARIGVQPTSIHKRYSETGSYHGVVPKRLPSKRLAWPLDAVEQILNGERNL